MKSIYKTLTEQFNINNMDFGNRNKKPSNIFNKNCRTPADDIYDNIIALKKISHDDRCYLMDKVSVVKVKSI